MLKTMSLKIIHHLICQCENLNNTYERTSIFNKMENGTFKAEDLKDVKIEKDDLSNAMKTVIKNNIDKDAGKSESHMGFDYTKLDSYKKQFGKTNN